MKMLFWSALILAAIWWLMKKSQGAGNDLTAHLEEQKALRSIGDSSLGANQIGTGNWPLATIGSTALSGLNIDPVNPSNPFTAPQETNMYQAEPTVYNSNNPFGLNLGK